VAGGPARCCNKTIFTTALEVGAGRLSLEGEPQPELDLPGSTERVDARSHPDAVHVVPFASSAVNLPRGSRQKAIERVPR